MFLNNPCLGKNRRLYRVIANTNIVAEFRQCPDFADLEHNAAIAEYKFELFAPA